MCGTAKEDGTRGTEADEDSTCGTEADKGWTCETEAECETEAKEDSIKDCG